MIFNTEWWREQFKIVDFKYISYRGLYVLTQWNGTLNGEPSTELVIPDNKNIML